jgi:hypothetical protein
MQDGENEKMKRVGRKEESEGSTVKSPNSKSINGIAPSPS